MIKEYVLSNYNYISLTYISSALILCPAGYFGSKLNAMPLTAGNLPSSAGYLETPFSSA